MEDNDLYRLYPEALFDWLDIGIVRMKYLTIYNRIYHDG